MSKNTLIVFHAECADGLTAAWVARKKFPRAEFFAAKHSGTRPDVTGKRVYILDFAYPRRTLQIMKKKAKSLLVLDHHVTAQKKLEGLDYCIFDMNKSGASLAWDYFFPNERRPWLVNYIEDRDLWKWQLADSREIVAGLDSYEKTFENWDALAQRPARELKDEGTNIIRYQTALKAQLKKEARLVKLKGYKVFAVNSTAVTDELGSELARGMPFAVVWRQRRDGHFTYSLRSTPEGIDVSQIATSLGGGGHRNAAGFESKKFLF